MLERSDRAVLGKRAGVPAGNLPGVQHGGEDLAFVDANLDAAPDQRRVEGVVAGIEAQIRIRGDAQHPPPVGIRRPVGKRRHHRAFLDQPVDRAGPQRLMHPRVRAIVKPGVELQLVVKLVSEAAPRLKRALHEVLQTLNAALGLRVRWAHRSTSRRAAARRTRRTRPSAARPMAVQPRLAIPNQRLRQRAERPQTPPDAPQQLRRLLGEHHGAGAGARVAQARHDDPAAAGLAMTDRDLVLGLPQIELADLPRPVDRPLKRPRCLKERADLPQVFIDDRLAPLEPQRRDQLADPLTRQRRVPAAEADGSPP